MRVLASPAFSNEKVNPYNALLYQEINKLEPASVEEYTHKKALLSKYDVIHFHWPDGYINLPGLMKSSQRIALIALIITVARIRGTKIVWTVHNIVPHDSYHKKLSRRFMNWFVHHCDGFIFMSEQSKERFVGHYRLEKDIAFAIIPHGHYRSSYPPEINQAEAKKQLGIPETQKVLLAFGMIKPYKNMDQLVKLFTAAKLTGYSLIIAGNPETPEIAAELKQLKAGHPDIHLFLTFIPDDEIHIYHSAADIVILPYKTILNSGALILALSFNKPVIAPHVGAFASLQKELGHDWIASYQAELDVATLACAITALEQAQRPATCPLTNYDWDKLGEQTLAFYRNLVTPHLFQKAIWR